MGIKICLGDEHTLEAVNRVKWIKSNFKPDTYKITCDGFLLNDYYVEFVDEKYLTLYYIRYPKE
jgi:hypothetical protein